MTKAEIINKCITLSKTEKTNSVMIGDTKHDAGSAQELAVDFIAVTYGFGFKSEADASEYANVCVCDSVENLSTFLINE